MITITLNPDGSLSCVDVGAAMVDAKGNPMLEADGQTPMLRMTTRTITAAQIAKHRIDSAFDALVKQNLAPADLAKVDGAAAAAGDVARQGA